MTRILAVLSSIAGALTFTCAMAIANFERQSYLPLSEAIAFGLIAAAGFGLMWLGAARFRGLMVLDVVLIGVLLVAVNAIDRRSGYSPIDGSMARVSELARAVEAYQFDHGAFPTARNLEELEAQLVPTYIRKMPREDAWRNELRYETWGAHYAVGSGGKNRQFEKASLRQYRQTTTTDPDCDIIFSDGKFIVYYERRPSVSPFQEATQLYLEDRFQEAVPLFEQHLHDHPNDALANARIAICLAGLNRDAEAMPYARKAADLDPTDYQSRSNLGLLYEKLHRPEEGIVWERAAAQIRPNDPEVLNNLGWVLMRAGHSDEARTVFEKVVRLAPNVERYRTNLREARNARR